jgi:hypothetical protein
MYESSKLKPANMVTDGCLFAVTARGKVIALLTVLLRHGMTLSLLMSRSPSVSKESCHQALRKMLLIQCDCHSRLNATGVHTAI